MEIFAELGKDILAVSPYALFVVIAYISAYVMFKISVTTIQKHFENAVEQIRKAYDSAYHNLKE